MKEEDIRPQFIFDKYLKLAANDAVTYFSDVQRVLCRCPACEASGEDAFEKAGFNYQLCNSCFTLFVSPRPVAKAFSDYYTNSSSSKYWATTFYPETTSARRELLWKPKAEKIVQILNEYSSIDATIIDIGGGYGLFAEEVYKLISGRPLIIEPSPLLAQACCNRGFSVVEKFLEDVLIEDLPVGKKLFVSFELFEHLHDPSLFLKHLYLLMAPGDLFSRQGMPILKKQSAAV